MDMWKEICLLCKSKLWFDYSLDYKGKKEMRKDMGNWNINFNL